MGCDVFGFVLIFSWWFLLVGCKVIVGEHNNTPKPNKCHLFYLQSVFVGWGFYCEF
jgi:hypothetical protein